MNKKLSSVILIVVISIALSLPLGGYGCVTAPPRPIESKQAVTSLDGVATLRSDLLDKDVNIKVEDEQGKPLDGIEAYFLNDDHNVVAIVVDPEGAYLPDIFTGSPEDFQESSTSIGLFSPVYAIEPLTGIVIYFVLIPAVTYYGATALTGAYEFLAPPAATALASLVNSIGGPVHEITRQVKLDEIFSIFDDPAGIVIDEELAVKYAVATQEYEDRKKIAEELVKALIDLLKKTHKEFEEKGYYDEIKVHVKKLLNLPIYYDLKIEPVTTPHVEGIVKPTVGYIPPQWCLVNEDPYGTYHEDDGTEWGCMWYADVVDNEIVQIFYGDICSRLKGRENDRDTLIAIATSYAYEFSPEEVGTMTIAGQLAGWVKAYDATNGLYEIEMVFVNGDTCVDIYVICYASEEDVAQVMSLIDSIK